MGEHLKKKLCAIEQWLRSRYGESNSRELDYIYSPEYVSLWKPRKHEADYVKQIDGKMVYVDVFSPNDDWRGVLGKALCYSANGMGTNTSYEVWLVTDLDDSPKVASLQGEERERHIDGWLMWFRDLKDLMKSTMKPEAAKRVRIWHAVHSGGELSLEEIK